MGSKRTIITLSEEDKIWLEGYGKAHKISMAEAIRKGIAQLKKADDLDVYRRLAENTKGLWKKGEGLEYQIKIRSEWELK